jgi:hypothetical protein
MKKPNKKDYDFNDYYELLEYTIKLEEYTNELEIKNQIK